jgi:hypothetical protein
MGEAGKRVWFMRAPYFVCDIGCSVREEGRRREDPSIEKRQNGWIDRLFSGVFGQE